MTVYGAGQGPVEERRPTDGAKRYETQEGRGACTTCWAQLDGARDEGGQLVRDGGDHLVAPAHRRPGFGTGMCKGEGEGMWPVHVE
jgi:hypothetical protein